MSHQTKTARDGNPDQEPLLGFFSIVELTKDLFRGGILLTDVRGKPRDFRCTSAIRPNAIQKVLYGRTLAEHLALELCGLPLLNALPNQPAVLLADAPDSLALRPESEVPMLWLRRQADAPSASVSGAAGDAVELIASESGAFEAVMASVKAGHEADLEWVLTLREMARTLDPLEPFGRIAAAMKLVQDKAGQNK